MLVPFPCFGAFVISGFSGAFGQNFKCSQVLEKQIFCPNGFAINVGGLFVWVFIFALAQKSLFCCGWRCNSALLWFVTIQSPLGIQAYYCSTLGMVPCPLGWELLNSSVSWVDSINTSCRESFIYSRQGAALASHQGDRAWESTRGGQVPRALAQERKTALKKYQKWCVFSSMLVFIFIHNKLKSLTAPSVPVNTSSWCHAAPCLLTCELAACTQKKK